jgi:hypothetical protein
VWWDYRDSYRKVCCGKMQTVGSGETAGLAAGLRVVASYKTFAISAATVPVAAPLMDSSSEENTHTHSVD